MPLIDSHCHFDFPAFQASRLSIWQACQAQGIERLIIPGTGPEQWPEAFTCTQTLSGVYMACGLHPWWADGADAATLAQQIHTFTQGHPVIAIGECGLDKHTSADLALQERLFATQLAIACDLKLPVIVHVRDTHNAVLRLLKQYRPPRGGVIHAFSGSLTMAQQYWQLGFYLGIGGIITYDRARKTRNAISAMPLESLLLETDAPDMPPSGLQGQPNSPANLPVIAGALADLQQLPLQQIHRQTYLNSQRLFFPDEL